jgi:hypothetical protein
LRPFRKRSALGDAPGEGVAVGRAVGRVVGIVTPCDDMQLRNALKAASKAAPPAPKPRPLGRSDAQAVMALRTAALTLGKPLGRPVGRAVGWAVGRAVGRAGSLTPCWLRQLRYALKLAVDGLAELDALAEPEEPHPAASSPTAQHAEATNKTLRVPLAWTRGVVERRTIPWNTGISLPGRLSPGLIF